MVFGDVISGRGNNWVASIYAIYSGGARHVFAPCQTPVPPLGRGTGEPGTCAKRACCYGTQSTTSCSQLLSTWSTGEGAAQGISV